MTKKEREKFEIIFEMTDKIESKLTILIKEKNFQIDALKKENVQLRDSLEKVEK